MFKAILLGVRNEQPPAQPNILDDLMGNILRQAWEEQERIGQQNILQGRLSKKWGRAQQLFYSANPLTNRKKHFTGDNWMTKTIESMIQLTLSLWKCWCEVLHGTENKDKKAILKADL